MDKVFLDNNKDIEHAVWVKNWGTLPDPNNLPPGVNTINIFEGKIDYVNGKWTIDGLNWPKELLSQYIQACHAKGITVKISIGGAGGQGIYNNTWDQLTDGNVQDVAKGLAQFCKDNNIDGIDFDYEEEKSDAQRKQVGELIRFFKQADPSLHASVCTCAGNNGTSSYSWAQDLAQIMDAAKNPDGSSAVDRIYVMSYDFGGQNLQDDEKFMLNWKQFAEQYGIGPSQISIGVDPTDPTMSQADKDAFIKFAYQNGFSTGMWDQMDYDEGKYTMWIFNEYGP
jgi:hypothetical protein